MSRTARDGAPHWAHQLRALRTEWERRFQAGQLPEHFSNQLEAAKERRVKSQVECLLRLLHLAAADGAVIDAELPPGSSPAWFGWTGFWATPGGRWRTMVEQLMPPGFNEETLRATFRRAGLAPRGWHVRRSWNWQGAWEGKEAFVCTKP